MFVFGAMGSMISGFSKEFAIPDEVGRTGSGVKRTHNPTIN